MENSMYIYGGISSGDLNPTRNDIFAFNLKTLTWKKIQQQTQIDLHKGDINGDVYQGHLITFNQNPSYNSKTSEFSCWDISSNTWSTFDLQKGDFSSSRGNLIVYKNLLIVAASIESGFGIAFLNLNNVGLSIKESSEQKRRRALFMSEQESDIMLKIQDKTIPAHKQILIEKSMYFANLFNSGMAESTQRVIDIADCEFSIFQEFMRFIYCDQIDLNEDLAIKLLDFADKYLQDDLSQKCIDYLTYNINSENVYTILDFARQENITILLTCCLKFIKEKINIDNVSGLMKYLDNQTNSEFARENFELRKKAIAVITEEYMKMSKKQENNLKYYTDFLIRSVELDTLPILMEWIWSGTNRKDSSKEEDTLIFDDDEENIIDLKRCIHEFVHENFASLKASNVLTDFANSFWIDFATYMVENVSKVHEVKETDTMEEEKPEGRGKKRRELAKTEETNPELKKTKKTSTA